MKWLDIPPLKSLADALALLSKHTSPSQHKTIYILIAQMLNYIDQYEKLKKDDKNNLKNRKNLLCSISQESIKIISALDPAANFNNIKWPLQEFIKIIQIYKTRAENKAAYLDGLIRFYQQYPAGIIEYETSPRVFLSPLTKLPTFRPTNDYIAEVLDHVHRPGSGPTANGNRYQRWLNERKSDSNIPDYFLWLEDQNEFWGDDEYYEQQVVYNNKVEDMIPFKIQFNDDKLYTHEGEIFSSHDDDSDEAIYVLTDPLIDNIDEEFSLNDIAWFMAGKHQIGEFHHSSFNGGKPVYAGGYFKTGTGENEGKIIHISNHTGHYKVGLLPMLRVVEFLKVNNGLSDDANIKCFFMLPKQEESIELSCSVDDFIAEGNYYVQKYDLKNHELENASSKIWDNTSASSSDDNGKGAISDDEDETFINNCHDNRLVKVRAAINNSLKTIMDNLTIIYNNHINNPLAYYSSDKNSLLDEINIWKLVFNQFNDLAIKTTQLKTNIESTINENKKQLTLTKNKKIIDAVKMLCSALNSKTAKKYDTKELFAEVDNKQYEKYMLDLNRMLEGCVALEEFLKQQQADLTAATYTNAF